MNSTSLLTGSMDGGQRRLIAGGAWTALHAEELDGLVGNLQREQTQSVPTVIDLSGVRQLDTFGARLLDRLYKHCGAGGAEVTVTGLPSHLEALVEAVLRVPVDGKGEPPRQSIKDKVAWLGERTVEVGRDFLVLVNLLGEVGAAAAAVIRRPQTFRLTATVHQLDRICWQAVPIILLITFLIGCIIAQQGFFHFRKFGADDYVVDMVGILTLREIGVLIVSIMVAGRSGSSCTAELGAMRMREEIDALRTMGLDPVQILILPRILALVVALPILTFIGSMAALYGGGLVASLYAGMSPEIYIARLKDAISLTHFKVGLIKAPFMALVIGIVACSEGLQVRGSAESLGLKTTASVVKSIFLVIVLDGLFAMFFASIGM